MEKVYEQGMVKKLLNHFDNDLPMDQSKIRKVLKRWGIKDLDEQNNIITAALKDLMK